MTARRSDEREVREGELACEQLRPDVRDRRRDREPAPRAAGVRRPRGGRPGPLRRRHARRRLGSRADPGAARRRPRLLVRAVRGDGARARGRGLPARRAPARRRLEHVLGEQHLRPPRPRRHRAGHRDGGAAGAAHGRLLPRDRRGVLRAPAVGHVRARDRERQHGLRLLLRGAAPQRPRVNLRRTLRECYRVLRPGGRLFVVNEPLRFLLQPKLDHARGGRGLRGQRARVLHPSLRPRRPRGRLSDRRALAARRRGRRAALARRTPPAPRSSARCAGGPPGAR